MQLAGATWVWTKTLQNAISTRQRARATWMRKHGLGTCRHVEMGMAAPATIANSQQASGPEPVPVPMLYWAASEPDRSLQALAAPRVLHSLRRVAIYRPAILISHHGQSSMTSSRPRGFRRRRVADGDRPWRRCL